MEIFTFLRLGATSNRLELIPIADDAAHVAASDAPSEASGDSELLGHALDRFRSFDVGRSKCFDEAQRQHLLGCIESGFGSFDVFNSIVRQSFTNKLEELLVGAQQSNNMSRMNTHTLRRMSNSTRGRRIAPAAEGYRVPVGAPAAA